MECKRITIKFPIDVWKKLSIMKIKGDIKSIQDAVIEQMKEKIKEPSLKN